MGNSVHGYVQRYLLLRLWSFGPGPTASRLVQQKGRTGELIKKHVGDGSEPHIVVVGKQFLFAQCLATCLRTGLGAKTSTFPDLESWLGTAGTAAGDPGGCLQAERFRLLHGPKQSRCCSRRWQVGLPTVVIADAEDLDQVLLAIEAGARGYIPTSLSIDIVVEAIRLDRCRRSIRPGKQRRDGARRAREASRQRQGHLAHSSPRARLRLCGLSAWASPTRPSPMSSTCAKSTVKVHVRNIMKKLSARNRTEVALIAKSLVL